MSYFFWVMDRLFGMLKEKITIQEDGIDKEITYAKPLYALHVIGLQRIKISMINNVFFVGFQINLVKLFKCFVKDKFNYTFDQARAQSINLKYKTDNMIKEITFLIFRTGKIMISGMGSYANIIECYKFINIYLCEHYWEIVNEN
jgi:TATA-box binding protein (TBP) (component of TFIID and TFIIIB)